MGIDSSAFSKDDTITLWQKRTVRQLTKEDARQMQENVSGFITVLKEWAENDETGK